MQTPFRSHFPELRKEIELNGDAHSQENVSQFNFNQKERE